MKSYDEYKRNKYIMYLDANNLYGWAMSQYLPYRGLKWLKRKEIDRLCLDSFECNSIGYILEVDLKYPDELHKLHNGYPLAPEKVEITQHMFSN